MCVCVCVCTNRQKLGSVPLVMISVIAVVTDKLEPSISLTAMTLLVKLALHPR